MNEKNRDVYREIIFGRNISRPESLFELVLSTPDMSNLICEIWQKFDLTEESEILIEVRIVQ